jgi:hypothetical protein
VWSAAFLQENKEAKKCYGGERAESKMGLAFYSDRQLSLHHGPTPLGNYPHRMKVKLGPKIATAATAHKIAPILCGMVNN